MVANTGTYVDAPSHRFEGAADIAGLTLESVADLPGLKITIPTDVTAIGRDFFRDLDVAGCAVIVHTGWSQHWRTDRYFKGHPYLTREAADCLESKGARLVGIDSLNIDDETDGERPVHTRLLKAGIPVVEHLCGLGQLPVSGFRFFAVPVRVCGLGSFPVRAFAVL